MNELLRGIGIVITDDDLENLLFKGDEALQELIESGVIGGVTDIDDVDFRMKPEVASLIKTIYVNRNKKTVTVKFTDGEIRTSRCYEDDEFDVGVGVSLCISYYLFGSRTAYNKYLAVNAYNHVIEKEETTTPEDKMVCDACIVPEKDDDIIPTKQIKKQIKKTKSRVKHL